MKVNYSMWGNRKVPAEEIGRWRGATAVLWGYVISHRILEIRLFNGVSGWSLSILCDGVEWISGPTDWSGARLEVEILERDRVLLRDSGVGFEVVAERIGVGENFFNENLGRGVMPQYPLLRTQLDPEPLLDHWRGRSGRLHGYEPFDRSLTIHIGEDSHYLRILCVGVDWLRGPTKWEGAAAKITLRPDGLYAVSDLAAGMEVVAEVARAVEIDGDSSRP